MLVHAISFSFRTCSVTLVKTRSVFSLRYLSFNVSYLMVCGLFSSSRVLLWEDPYLRESPALGTHISSCGKLCFVENPHFVFYVVFSSLVVASFDFEQSFNEPHTDCSCFSFRWLPPIFALIMSLIGLLGYVLSIHLFAVECLISFPNFILVTAPSCMTCDVEYIRPSLRSCES